jgi:hypothetical protein
MLKNYLADIKFNSILNVDADFAFTFTPAWLFDPVARAVFYSFGEINARAHSQRDHYSVVRS